MQGLAHGACGYVSREFCFVVLGKRSDEPFSVVPLTFAERGRRSIVLVRAGGVAAIRWPKVPHKRRIRWQASTNDAYKRLTAGPDEHLRHGPGEVRRVNKSVHGNDSKCAGHTNTTNRELAPYFCLTAAGSDLQRADEKDGGDHDFL